MPLELGWSETISTISHPIAIGTLFAGTRSGGTPIMLTTTRGIVAMVGAFALVSFISLQPAFAAQAPAPPAPGAQAPAPAPAPAPAAQAPAQKAESVKGELRSIDVAKKTLTLTVEGKQQAFQYTDATKVTGAQGGIEGLATMSGRQVTVQYSMKGADRVATSIDVAAK
jgi:hypothetical protein